LQGVKNQKLSQKNALSRINENYSKKYNHLAGIMNKCVNNTPNFVFINNDFLIITKNLLNNHEKQEKEMAVFQPMLSADNSVLVGRYYYGGASFGHTSA
jgi:hypothetical protein